MVWKDENRIDTLAAAYAEMGDFDSAVQYAFASVEYKRHLADGYQKDPAAS
jgi:hypothetical protein